MKLNTSDCPAGGRHAFTLTVCAEACEVCNNSLTLLPFHIVIIIKECFTKHSSQNK